MEPEQQATQPRTTQITDLPLEVLELIFDHLSLADLKNASLVCRLWSYCGMEHVRLKIDYCLQDPEDYLRLFRASKRQYRHVMLALAYDSEEYVLALFIKLLKKFKRCVTSLKVRPNMFIGLPQLRHLLLEVPNLRALSVHARYWNSPDPRDGQFLPFPVMDQLSELVLESDTALQLKEFDIPLFAPNLRSLDMDCDSERALEVYKHYSERLKTLGVFFKNDDYFLPFCEVSFPSLCKIDFYSSDEQLRDSLAVKRIAAFFARMKRLRQAKLRCNVPQRIVNALVASCADLTFLHIKTERLADKAFARLTQLTKLKILVLDDKLKSKVFDDCKPLLSLQELRLRSLLIDGDDLEFYTSLSKTATQLRVLKANETNMDDNCLLFICNNFPTITTMVLEFCPYLTANGFACLHQLPNLRNLSLGFLRLEPGSFKEIPSNQISHFSLCRCGNLTDEDLLEIPRAFESLKCLEIRPFNLITSAGIRRLRALLPLCIVLEECADF